MLDAKVSIENSRFWVRGWIRDCVLATREDDEEEDEGWSEVSD